MMSDNEKEKDEDLPRLPAVHQMMHPSRSHDRRRGPPIIFCKVCKAENPRDALKCKKCGSNLV